MMWKLAPRTVMSRPPLWKDDSGEMCVRFGFGLKLYGANISRVACVDERTTVVLESEKFWTKLSSVQTARPNFVCSDAL